MPIRYILIMLGKFMRRVLIEIYILGTGGDRRGRLIAAQNFDDDRCYQINTGNISLTRQRKFPDPVEGQPESVHEQWCETDIAIPTDISINATYTV